MATEAKFFAGYDRYRALQYFKLARFLMPLTPVARALARWPVLPTRARRAFAGAGHDPREGYARIMSYFSPEQKTAIYSDEMRTRVDSVDSYGWMYSFMRESGEPLGVRLLQYSDAMTYLSGDILAKVDIATMANSLEGRSPLLDHELLEWAFRLPENISSNGTEGKLVLKALARKYLPASVIDRPKMGFGIPIDDWFKGELQTMARDTLLSRRARERGLFNPAKVEALITDHASGQESHGYRLWALLCLELWFCEMVDAQPPPSAGPGGDASPGSDAVVHGG